MKKIIRIMAAALILTLNVNVWAAEIDLSGYDDAALVELMAQVQQEVAARNIEKTADLSAGTYIGGRDIPAGTYVWTCKAVGDDWGNITVYSLDEAGNHDKQKMWQVAAAPEEGEEPETFMITINEGEELDSGIPFSLTIYAGAKFY